MMKRVHETVKNYSEAYKQALKIHKQAVDHINANYRKDSEMYKSAMSTAEATLNEATRPMKAMFVQESRKCFDEVRKQVKQAVTVAPSAELLGILPLIKEGKMKDLELQMFVEKFNGNYMNSKLIHDALGESFRPVESIMEQIDSVEAKVNGYFESYKGESLDKIKYSDAMILGGSAIQALDEVTSSFLDTYGNGGVE